MSFIQSLFCETPGVHRVFGEEVEFVNHPFKNQIYNGSWVSLPSYVLNKIFAIKMVRILSLSALHVWVHEMGHAVATRLLTNVIEQKVWVYSSHYSTGRTKSEYWVGISTMRLKDSVITAAGPVVSMAFCSLKLVATVALKNYLFKPLTLVLGLGSLLWMIRELAYAALSIEGKGDFADIAKNNTLHLTLATITLVAFFVLGIRGVLAFR